MNNSMMLRASIGSTISHSGAGDSMATMPNKKGAGRPSTSLGGKHAVQRYTKVGFTNNI
jgi:hypothetical protein